MNSERVFISNTYPGLTTLSVAEHDRSSTLPIKIRTGCSEWPGISWSGKWNKTRISTNRSTPSFSRRFGKKSPFRRRILEKRIKTMEKLNKDALIGCRAYELPETMTQWLLIICSVHKFVRWDIVSWRNFFSFPVLPAIAFRRARNSCRGFPSDRCECPVLQFRRHPIR